MTPRSFRKKNSDLKDVCVEQEVIKMATFTCLTCHVAFFKFELQREHYKSDWHRYNLKRKVAELPPVTAENFQQRVLSQQSNLPTGEQDNAQYCQYCRKHFSNQNAFSNHLNSKKHVEAVEKKGNGNISIVDQKNVRNAEKNNELVAVNAKELSSQQIKDAQNLLKKLETQSLSSSTKTLKNTKNVSTCDDSSDEDEDMEDWEDVEGEPLGLEECLFCSTVSSDLSENLQHMTDVHSFFIPDIEYLVNLEGLISYLGEKVGTGFICLWCNEKGKSFYSAKSVQQHMVDKGHCKLLHEGSVLEEYAEFYDYSTSYPDHSDNEVASDEEIEINEINGEGYQMVLPSGATIGHRSLMRYYRLVY